MPDDPATAMYRERADALATVRGDGPPVLCAHGTLMDRTMFRPQQEALADDYRVAAYDLRARTDNWAGPYDLWDLADDAVAAMDGLGMDAPVFVGMSMGGYLGLRVALAHPDRLSGLVLVDSMAGAHTEAERQQYGSMVDQLAAADRVPEPLADTVTHVLFGETTRERRPALVERWRDRWLTYRPDAVVHEVRSYLDDPGVADRLDEVDVPVLVVHGEEDAALAPERGAAVAEGVPDGRLERVPDAGHSANLERPAPVDAAVRSFLERVA